MTPYQVEGVPHGYLALLPMDSFSSNINVAVQGRLEQLPPELWAKVLQQLNIQDLLQARQVSKHFVHLSSLLQLDMSWSTRPEAKGGSLALFMR